MKGETKMTQGRLQALTELNNRIEHLENVLTELQCADGLAIYAYDRPYNNNKYLIDDFEDMEDLRARIINYYDNLIAKLKKEFEEA
jgi:hypothetical protein